MIRPVRQLASLTAALLLLGAIPATAQPIENGVAFLLAAQAEDGSWSSREARRPLTTTAALRALQVTDRAPAARFAAADYLETEPILDHDDLSRRLIALAAEGRIVDVLQSDLVEGRDPQGGWGLIPGFTADPLDTALALRALAGPLASSDEVLVRGLFPLLFSQKEDGGFPCVESGDGNADSRIFCTSHALLALSQFRAAFFLDQDVLEAADFLRSQLQLDGSLGPGGSRQVLHTALASLALATVPALNQEIPGIVSFLKAAQQPDGSWQGDPYVTAIVLQALSALSQVPFCGDGVVNRTAEACDGFDLAGLTCEGVDLGPGTLGCSSQCTLDTSGCTDPPTCGDDLRNQSFELCDGTDLAGESCESLAFDSGTLACASDCETFDVSGCHIEPFCGDGLVNRTGESCDLSDLNGQTCEAMGLGTGPLQCANDCRFDTSLCDAATFTLDNAGREFIVGFLPNPSPQTKTVLRLISEEPTTARIEYPVVDPRFAQTVAIQPNFVTVVELPSGPDQLWPAGRASNNAVRVSATHDIVVYAVNRRDASSDAAMTLPVNSLGNSYIVNTYSQGGPQFLVLAPFDNTQLTIRPSTTLLVNGERVGAGETFRIILSRGQGFLGQFSSGHPDFTGTLVEANRPIALFHGNKCATVPTGVFPCDHLYEAAHPLRSWGTSALVTNFPNRPGGSIYRVVASAEETEVRLDGDVQALLNMGEFFEVGPLPGSHRFEANRPIFVTQFMTGQRSPGAINGDPAMVNMIPPDQYASEYTFSTVGEDQFSSHFLTVTASDSSLGSVLLDGEPIAPEAFSPVGDSGFSSAVVPLTEGTHRTSSPEPHGITIEGLDFADSYAFPGGSRLEITNRFCGDGAANQEIEECDENDFHGSTCASFGFASGRLQCTSDCRVDTSQCFGLAVTDEDDDGFPAAEDCNDQDPEIHPNMAEIFDNSVDDDCNPATPDEIPITSVGCTITSRQVRYGATDVIQLEARINNEHEAFTLTGLHATLYLLDGGQIEVQKETRQSASLPPGARTRLDFGFSIEDTPPGNYTAELEIMAGLEIVAQCSTGFTIESSGETGVGLVGTLMLSPNVVNAGEPSNAVYSVSNRGNAALTDLALRVLLVEPQTGVIVAEIRDQVSLQPGQAFEAAQDIATQVIESNTSYLALLRAQPSGSPVEMTLASSHLTAVNAPPDCSAATAVPALLWPPNHQLGEITLEGVRDPDGDPISLTWTDVFQDEPTKDLGSGDTCPDASGAGTTGLSVRAERSGRQDGRVYHLFFTAEDGRGGACEGKVTVCVPRDQRTSGVACVDQGMLYDSSTCK